MVNIVVTGIGGGGVGEQVIQALSVSDIKYFIIGTDITPISRNYLNVDAFEVIPKANEDNYIEELVKICREFKVEVLIPGSEPELKIISKNLHFFEEEKVFVFINPASVLEICLDKFKTASFLKENGFKTPRTVQIKSSADLHSIDYFPLVLKPSVGGGGSVNTMIAQSKDELELFGKYLLQIYDEFIVQEYVGNPSSEFTVGVLIDYNGDLIDTIIINRDIITGLSNRSKVKNTTGLKSLGDNLVISSGISQGEVVFNDVIKNTCEKIALNIGARGAFNIQCRLHEGEVYVFEINPRFSGTCSLRALSGFNEPDLLLKRHLLNKEIYYRILEGYVIRGLSGIFISKQ